MQPLVSILIPAYNCEPWLGETLQSVLAQTWKNIEVIIVDDGSTDSTLAIANQYKSAQVKVISQDNSGQSAAENLALQEAQGDFIEFLDGDDLLAPDKIERQIDLLNNQGPRIVAAGEWARFYDSSKEATFTPEPIWADFSPVDWLICSWEGGGMMHGAAWLIPRTIAEQVGPWNEQLSLINDVDYFTRVLLASNGIKFCWSARSYYRSFKHRTASNLSNAKSRAALESGFLALELATNHLLATEDSDRTRHACATAIQRFIYSVYPDALDLIEKAEKRVAALGGTNLQPSGGSRFQSLSRIVGWKVAKRLQRLTYA